MPISVRMVLPTEENRFCRTQAMGPAVLTGGRMVCSSAMTAMACSYLSTSAMRVLNQFMKAEVSRLIVRNTSMVRRIISTAWPV